MGFLRLKAEEDVNGTRLDELAIGFSRLLSRLESDHVFVAGYVAILAGRSRSTEDVDVFIERWSSGRIDDLVTELERDGYRGPAMPLSETYGTLASGTSVWVAPDGETTPHLEVIPRRRVRSCLPGERDRRTRRRRNDPDLAVGASVLSRWYLRLQGANGVSE
ncbi:hypothetical protein ACFPM1_00065 [Halorubrum rubrum]|uniref:Nucleotidyltransferase family protein n=1 Tax=Halorubrum rubrum TaxID=1126240 RepID=A0ABD5QXF7_9EURY|nr:hypothetical protein [Halorubrum rubrum]